MKKVLSAIIVLFVLALSAGNLFAQTTGRISGKVIDQKTSETLIGATVNIQGTTKAAATDVEGHYVISGLEPGRYTILVRYIGYQSKTISDIEVKAGGNTPLDITVGQAESKALNEVVIKATYRQESVGALYAIQKNSVSISDGISSELIRKSPDRNTSDVLKRVSGTTIQDNKFVVVRGLSDRYNTASLDGAPLPSTEPNRKAFSFDIVPSNLIDNIVISKTASPDIAGDFAGGNVQIMTKDIPDQNFVTIGVGAGYNTLSTFKDFKSGYRSTSDYFAFDDGSRKLVANFPSTEQIVNKQVTGTRNIQSINSLNNDFSVYTNKALPTQNYQLTIGNVKEIGANKNRFGTTVALTYRNSQNITPDLIQRFNDYDYHNSLYKFSTNVGALANFAYSFGKNKITFKNLYNRILDDQFTYRTGTNLSTSSDNRFYAYDLLTKALFKSTVEGEHALGEKNSKIKWNLGYSNIVNDQPDQRKVNYKSLNGGDYVAQVTGLQKENARFFSHLNENIYSGKVDYSLPVNLFKQSTLKVGLNSQYRDRTFGARFLGLVLNTNNPNYPNASDILTRPIETLFGQNAINAGLYNLDELSNPTDRYTANSLTNATYAMLDSKIGEKVRIVYGLRVEKFDLNLESADKTKAKVNLDNLDFLPSVNFTYALTPKANFRASYARTIARPEFRELANFAYYDYELLATVQGEPALKRTSIDNADLRYEFYPSAGQIFSVSAFYKRFQNAIEPYIDDQNSSTTISYFNSKSAYVYGFELEARKALDFVNDSKFFKNTTAYANFSFNKSQVTNPDVVSAKDERLEKKRPLVGQSPYVINAGISHTELDNKLSLNLLFNRLGKRIFYAGGQTYSSVYESPRNVLDFQVGYKVIKNRGEIKFSGSDILHNNYNFTYELDGKPYVPSGQGNIFRNYNIGSNYALSFNYTF
ncbi:TonB-dependent receptor [Mucilaginibacter phyllosphaerae]|uniref:TonB-dependent receptor n=1 Tax=Mucilaginibacter phyllosphaerae TaxID=1812349 RepID=A0ABR6I5U8_9SPHI|nr:TonB-dependent receptor [Mucilaginibacter phyllosphaerae]MBB3968413.1 TonB-dependent receptor [Mucilaginibacter phyllosphaerae]GGH16156.1 TonB-dependent receptor [Mucilaginibacter phyllosphaerae]